MSDGEHNMQTKETQNIDWAERPLFRKDQQLTPERLNRIHDHQATRLRHALLGIAGPGIVYGYRIRTDKKGLCECESGKIYISCGLAIDGYGRQLYWPGGWVGVEQVAEKPDCAGDYTLGVHYAERRTDAGHQCGCPPEQADWVEEGVVFTLRKDCQKFDKSCPKAQHEQEGKQTPYCDQNDHCITQEDYICSRSGFVQASIPGDENLHKLCEDPSKLCHVGCDDWLYDADAGLSLACVVIDNRAHSTSHNKNPEPRWGFAQEAPKICGYRCPVYRNSLLYELINGCHLDHARVSEISCKESGRKKSTPGQKEDKSDIEDWLKTSFEKPVSWQQFCDAIEGGIVIRFSKPIKASTIHDASIFATAVVRDKDTYFQGVWRLPVEVMKKLDLQKDSEGEDYVQGICLEFDKKWSYNQLKTEVTRFNFGAVIEITVRGAMLRDICGNMLDGRPLDCPQETPGQAMPGGDFVAAFCVENRPSSGGGKEAKA